MSEKGKTMKEVIRIDYPPTAAGKKQWNKRYGTNAYWAGKHHAAMNKAHVRKKPFEKPVLITFLWNDSLDLDNHSMMEKMIVDGLKKKLINDDSRRWVKGIEHYWHDEKCIKVIIRECED